MPPWVQAPSGTIPGVVALELALARTDRVAVFITRLAGYPEGFAFDLVALAAPADDQENIPDPMLFGPGRHHLRRGGGQLPDEMLRIGVEFSDGRKATNIGGFPHRPMDFETPPPGPVMRSGGGGGGERQWHQSQWVWPLPPSGPLAFVCQWPAAGIPLTRHEFDAQLILDAAERAQVVFPDAPHQSRGSVTVSSVGIRQVRPSTSSD